MILNVATQSCMIGGRTPSKPVPKTFSFDRVFDEEASQADIYNTVSPFVQSVLEGYNATVFAYGQTGAGKTYTMMGDSGSLGVIPRAVCTLFDVMSAENDSNMLYSVRMTYVELYNDRFRDLLSPNNDPGMSIGPIATVVVIVLIVCV